MAGDYLGSVPDRSSAAKPSLPTFDHASYLAERAWRQDLADEPVTQIGKRNELHLMLLYAVLVLLFVETLLAWKFGHHRV